MEEGKEPKIGFPAQTPREIMAAIRAITSGVKTSLSENPRTGRALSSFYDSLLDEVRKGLSDIGGSFNNVQIYIPFEISKKVEELVVDPKKLEAYTGQGVIFQGTKIEGLYFKSGIRDLPNQRDYSIVGVNHLLKTPA